MPTAFAYLVFLFLFRSSDFLVLCVVLPSESIETLLIMQRIGIRVYGERLSRRIYPLFTSEMLIIQYIYIGLGEIRIICAASN